MSQYRDGLLDRGLRVIATRRAMRERFAGVRAYRDSLALLDIPELERRLAMAKDRETRADTMEAALGDAFVIQELEAELAERRLTWWQRLWRAIADNAAWGAWTVDGAGLFPPRRRRRRP